MSRFFTTVWSFKPWAEIKGATTFIGQPRYSKHAFKLPLMLQEHRQSCFIQKYLDKGNHVTTALDGTDTKGWYTYLDSLGKEIMTPLHNFFLVTISCDIEGKYFGYIRTGKKRRETIIESGIQVEA